MFELKYSDGLARIGKLQTPHGTLTTPTLLPVINPNYQPITPQEMKKLFGINALITNSYIIYKNEEKRKLALENGVHNLLDFDGIIMTDSGTFQSYVYGEIDIDNETIVKFQRDIKVDIATILDEFVIPDDSYDIAREKVETTIKRAKPWSDSNTVLAFPVQGGIYKNLREYCSRKYSELEGNIIHPIGGVVPLLENYRFAELAEIILTVKKDIPISRPIHLFGCGHPMFFAISVLLGCDMFDSASYAKYAKDNRLMFVWGTRTLDDLIELPCSCPVCSSIDIEMLKKLSQEEREILIMKHNLYVSFEELKNVHQAIYEGSIWELAERRANAHPKLVEIYSVLKEYRDFFEEFEPLYRISALFVISRNSLYHPAIYRVQRATCNVQRAMCEVYPLNTIVYPENYPEDIDIYKTIKINREAQEDSNKNSELEILKSILDYQFSEKVSDYILKEPVTLWRSPNTKKIRRVYRNNVLLFSILNSGFVVPTIEMAKILHREIPAPKLRVTVKNEVSEFILAGKSVFSKFVVDADPRIRNKSEVLIVNEKDELLGTGKALMNRREMLSFKRGVAVEVRRRVL